MNYNKDVSLLDPANLLKLAGRVGLGSTFSLLRK